MTEAPQGPHDIRLRPRKQVKKEHSRSGDRVCKGPEANMSSLHCRNWKSLLVAERRKKEGTEGGEIVQWQGLWGPWGTNAHIFIEASTLHPSIPQRHQLRPRVFSQAGFILPAQFTPSPSKTTLPLSVLSSRLILTLLASPSSSSPLPPISHTLLIVCVQHTVHSPFCFCCCFLVAKLCPNLLQPHGQ